MGRADIDRVIRTSVELEMGACAFLGDDDCPPMLVLHSELTAPLVAEDRRAQIENRNSYLAFLRAHHWRRYVEGEVPAHSFDWRLTLLVAPANIKAMVLHKGIPVAYSGTLFGTITPDARRWLAQAVQWQGVWIFYLTDPGPLPEQAELQALSEQGRAYMLAVPIEITAGV
jgi:hypothetical protein